MPTCRVLFRSLQPRADMALSARSEDLKRVPWFSLAEWHDVYKQIYSNDYQQQTRGYETLLVWKSRMAKLPVGIECTLSLIEVCLRDRSWSPLINSGALPMYQENDLCLMYSTTIMRFLNHVSNIGPTKQNSLFQIAKQLRIPEWIVNLRHDAAHGHQLPSITLLRLASNVLLSWLYDEYWAPEAQVLEKRNEVREMESEGDSSEDLLELIQLWISVGLYIESDLSVVSELPDEHLQNALISSILPEGDTSKGGNHLLTTVRSQLLMEISNLLRKSKYQKALSNTMADFIINSQIFLVNQEIFDFFSRHESSDLLSDDQRNWELPRQLVVFWQPMITLLHETKLLKVLTLKLIEVINADRRETNQRKLASLWMKVIGQSLLKLKIAQKEAEKLEHSQEGYKKTPQKAVTKKIEGIINRRYQELRDCPWLAINSDIPSFFTDESFSERVIMNASQFTHIFIETFLELISPGMNAERKANLLELLRIQSAEVIEDAESDEMVVHTVEDLERICGRVEEEKLNEDEESEAVADELVRNSQWELAPGNFNWGDCAFGVLPWQVDSMDSLAGSEAQPEVVCPDVRGEIVAGIVEYKQVPASKRVDWEKVLWKNQRGKRKSKREADKVMDKAIQIVKTKKV